MPDVFVGRVYVYNCNFSRFLCRLRRPTARSECQPGGRRVRLMLIDATHVRPMAETALERLGLIQSRPIVVYAHVVCTLTPSHVSQFFTIFNAA